MASIVYKSLSALSPVELKYQYYRDEELQSSYKTYSNGLTLFEIDGLQNFQDVAINKDSCFILTSSVSLSSIFTPSSEISIGKLPTSIQIQPRNSTIYYAKIDAVTNTFKLSTSGSNLYIQPIDGTNEVEVYTENKLVQVDSEYPYVVRTSDRSLDPEELYRQRFEVMYQGGYITFKTKTLEGYRYLAFNNDNTLRATGLVMNNSVVNDYVFKCIPVTDDTTIHGFTPTNNWVTYFYDIESGQDSKTVTINKNINTVETNLLIDLPIEKAAETGSVNINIANLKTAVTPGGGPAPVDNAYEKSVITTN